MRRALALLVAHIRLAWGRATIAFLRVVIRVMERGEA